MSSVYHPNLSHVSHDDKYYSLTMFPYPSGYGLHVGHVSNFVINDVNARYHMMQGKTVLNPMGFDSFGLPTENYAMKVGRPAHEVTEDNIANFQKQLDALGMSFDPGRQLATSDPSYYKWTQRLFQKLFEYDLVYRSEQFVNRCPSCQTVLANDQVVENACERCGAAIVQKQMPQWFIKTTAYADDLINGLDDVDRPEHTKQMQRNWIGRSEGTYIDFYANEETPVTVFTTRVDTIYGVTAIVLAPENTVIDHLLPDDHEEAVLNYRHETMAKTSVDRLQGQDQKSGVFSGVTVFHPLTHKHIPVWYADYVLPDYATGSVMMVPAHDARDRAFAQTHKIPYITVLDGEIADGHVVVRDGLLINSDQFSGMSHDEAKYAITQYLQEHDIGRAEIMYKLRDWSVSRQRYRGCPIPVYYDDEPVSLGNEIEGAESYDAVVAIVRDPESGMFLTTNWTSSKGSKLFVYGRRQSDETYVEAARRHVRMDTGYSDLALVDWANNITFHYVTDEGGRRLRVCAFLFDLESDQRDDVDPSKSERFVAEWIEADQVTSAITGDLHTYVYELLVTGIIERHLTPRLIPEEQLPVRLPTDVENYKPAGVSPLADHKTFPYYEVGEMLYRRECDTLDTFMCSSFYFLRYPDVGNDMDLCGARLRQTMFPVDFYIGGMEHTVGHLLYSRFVMRFLHEIGYVSTPEPFAKLMHQGMVMGADGRKMSKRRGNVIDPLDVIEQYGSDQLRTYLLFMGPVDQDKVWDDSTLHGVSRFLARFRALWTEDGAMVTEAFAHKDDDAQQAGLQAVDKALHHAIKGVTEDIESYKYNTAISKLMVLVNAVYEVGSLTKDQYVKAVQLVASFAPGLAEEKRALLGQSGSVFESQWPEHDPLALIEHEVTLAVQINGKMRGTIEIERNASEDVALELVRQHPSLAKYVHDVAIRKVIYIPNKIMNIIVG